MIRSEAFFVGCRNLPDDMAAALDRAWEFVGAIRSPYPHGISALCVRCNPPIHILLKPDFDPTARYQIVDLSRRRFITDDYLIVEIYFGTCDRCARVFWARVGPPFQRLRRCVPAT